jgi:hypothetical protein
MRDRGDLSEKAYFAAFVISFVHNQPDGKARLALNPYIQIGVNSSWQMVSANVFQLGAIAVNIA